MKKMSKMSKIYESTDNIKPVGMKIQTGDITIDTD